MTTAARNMVCGSGRGQVDGGDQAGSGRTKMMAERRTFSSWFRWPTWFAARSRRAAERRKAEDFADYGTAFGLDLSMDPKTDATARTTRPAANPTPTKGPVDKR